MKRIILIGGIGKPNEFGGELTKNKEIVKRFKELGYSVSTIDTKGANHSVIKLFLVLAAFFYSVIFHRKYTFIFSSSFNNIRRFLRFVPEKTRTIYWVIGGIFGERVLSGDIKTSEIEKLDMILVEGNLMKKQLEQKGIKNVFVVPNFKTIDFQPDILSEVGYVRKFVFLSRIIPQKGVDNILASCKELNEDLKYKGRFSVDFYGTIDEFYEESFCKQTDLLKNVNYKGKLDLLHNEGYDILAEYDCMLFPTFWRGEGFPGVVIDAYIAGLPIIASDWNFNPEFVDESVGEVIPHNNLKVLTDAMKRMIDSNKLPQYKKASFSRAMNFDTKKIITLDFAAKIVG